MGNTLGGKKTAKIMKIDGETIKFKTPIQAKDVVKDYPGHVVLDSVAVKHYGIRAKPLDPFQNLEPKKLYFLVELPKFPLDNHQHRVPRRVRSGIQMSAKDRLESLMLSRRSVSDLSIMGPATRVMVHGGTHDGVQQEGGEDGVNSGLRVRVKLPKAEVERLMSGSRDQDAVAEKIVALCLGNTGQNETSSGSVNDVGNGTSRKGKEVHDGILDQPLARGNRRGYKKRVGFMPVHEGEIRLAVASS